MRKYLIGLIALAFLGETAIEAAAQPLMLEPVSPWVADFQDDSCAVRRTFAGGGQQITVELSNFGLGDGFDVGLAGATLRASSALPRARFEPDEGIGDHPEAVRLTLKGGGRGLLYSDQIFRRIDVDKKAAQTKSQGYSIPWDKEFRRQRENEITALFVAGAYERDLVFETGPLKQPMDVMRQCVDDLVKSKGVDPAVLSTLARTPAPKHPMGWEKLMLDAYPRDLVREHKSGTVRLRLLVDENGKVAGCATRQAGEDPRFDKAACDGAARYARFDPALDAAGKPTKAFWSTTIIYSLH